MDTWILSRVRATSLRRVVAWSLALVAGVLLATSERRYVRNFVSGPFELGAADLQTIADVDEAPRYFARVRGTKVIDTGLRQYTVRTSAGVETSRSESGAYYALVVGDKFLIVKTGDADVTPTVAEGQLAAFPSSLDEQLFDSKEMRELRPRFYSFYLNNESFRLPGYVVIGLALVFGFFFLRLALPAWKHYRNPASHPLMKRVETWGEPLGVAVEVERDFHEPALKGGNGWVLGNKYLVRSTLFTFNVLRFTDLLWAYKKVTKHSINFIPTGKTYEAILACYGGSAVIKVREKRLDEMLAFAAQRAPWAVFGYTAELATLFSKKPSEFAAAVEQRRRKE